MWRASLCSRASFSLVAFRLRLRDLPNLRYLSLMRIAALYDIHGNLPALEAVLDEIRGLDVDQIVIGGDVVPGPMPRERFERLMRLDRPARFIHGNGDREILALLEGREMTTVPAAFTSVMHWVAGELGANAAREFARWS